MTAAPTVPGLGSTPDPVATRHAFSRFPSGVAALAARVDGAPTVLIASSFTVGVSLEPPMVLFAVQDSSTTWPVLRRAPRLGVSVLGTAHAGVARQLADKDKARRFEGVATRTSPTGALFLAGSPVRMECAIVSEVPAGDHHVVLLAVEALHEDPEQTALVWHASTFRRLGRAG